MAIETQSGTQATIDRHDRFMSLNYTRYPIAMVEGSGCRLRDADGKRYLDLFSGFGATIMGHCHPDLVAAVTQQAGRLWHVGNLLHTEPQTRVAEAIARHGFGGRSFFCHSGADANEAAFKLARLYGHTKAAAGRKRRFKIISMDNSFHGRSFATMAATGAPSVRAGFDPMIEGFQRVPYNDLAAAQGAVDADTVAVIVEPIQGEGGIVVPDDGYLAGLRSICDKHDVLLICDEVWTGCGRTGRYFAHQHWSIEPDIMTLGKGVGGGLAVGVMCAKPKLAELYNSSTQGGVKHATTLGGNCLSMAAAAAVFDVLERDDLVQRAHRIGEAAMLRLAKSAERCRAIRQVRGKGLFIGVELDLQAGGTAFKTVADVVARCMERGVLVNGTQQNVLRLAPPLIVTEEEFNEGLDVIEQVLNG